MGPGFLEKDGKDSKYHGRACTVLCVHTTSSGSRLCPRRGASLGKDLRVLVVTGVQDNRLRSCRMGTRWQCQLAGKSSSITGTRQVLLARKSFRVVSEPGCTCGFHRERLWTWPRGDRPEGRPNSLEVWKGFSSTSQSIWSSRLQLLLN